MHEDHRNTADPLTAGWAGCLKEEFGGLWTGVAFHDEAVLVETPVEQEMRLCEAVARSFVEPTVLPTQKIGCPGARRALGLLDDGDALAQRISQKSGIPLDALREVLAEAPCLAAPIAAVSLGAGLETPDVVVGYVQPKQAMSLLRRWQVSHRHVPVVPLSSFLAVCAWVVVRAYKLDEICVSFGCFDSRQYGGIGGDTLVVGMPTASVQQMVSP